MINNNRSTALGKTAAKAPGDEGVGMLNAFYWRQIFTLDSAGVKTLKLISFLIYAMPHHRDKILIKVTVTHYDETKKRAYASQIV